MKKIFKIFSTSLMALALVATSLVGNTTLVNAATQQNQGANKIKDHVQAIQLIEAKFLTQDSDGTTSIDQSASKYIDADILKQIEDGSKQINKKIKSGDLKFDKNSKKLIENKHASPAGAQVSGSYIWHWYGFDFVMDAYNSGLAAISLNSMADKVTVGTGVVTLMGNISFGIAGGITAYMCYGFAEDCELGKETGRGAILYFYGDPSWAQIYNSSVR